MFSIISTKEKICDLEREQKRLPIYQLLRAEWYAHSDNSELALLIMQQMAFFLDELETPWAKPEREDEYECYYNMLQSVLGNDLKEYCKNKFFLWQLCFYLSSIATYHYILGDIIRVEERQQWRHSLFLLASEHFPQSMLFKIIPYLQGNDDASSTIISLESKLKLSEELCEWNLQSTMVDQEIKHMFNFLEG